MARRWKSCTAKEEEMKRRRSNDIDYASKELHVIGTVDITEHGLRLRW
jgi:hypothetical protein